MRSHDGEVLVRVGFRLDGDAQAEAELARQLRFALSELEIDARPERVPAGPGGRGGEETPGTLLVRLTPGIVATVAGAVVDWFRRTRMREVEIEIGDRRIKLSHATTDQQERLLALFEAQFDAEPAGDV